MSRIGNRRLVVPEGLEVENNFNSLVFKKDGKTRVINYDSKIVSVELQDSVLSFKRENNSKTSNMMQGTLNSLALGAIIGLTQGFEKKLIIEGVGYRALDQGNDLILSLGYSRDITLKIPEEVKLEVLANGKELILKSHNKETLGEFTALIKKQRPVEPYKGKGIRIEGEHVIRKQGKSSEGGKK
ncbi:50S ribosomal protein L6 [Candidatus Mycoplasma haematolamae str. Purdue]|uniref:50S ribosomal protein L6 n=1 Tax=Mycoplasma haematolamae (strain Purdue) TaxID=1212765 RepID=I7BJU9_MYCHA|nr:50S ribosomal protein L6 [Candidatus Mycoplasma haematolamae]AFO52143.1 50S ribosomal protein L6 [Candidatus Mycoplasma haematolamae str. Purdue]